MKIYVVFYSMYGHIYRMAEAVAEGARQVAGAEVSLFQVQELVHDVALEKSGAKKPGKHLLMSLIQPAQLADADAILFGTPTRFGNMPSYSQKAFDLEEKRGQWRLIASADGRDGSLVIHQDASLLQSGLSKRQGIDYALPAGRHAWVQVMRGEITLNGTHMETGDGAVLSDEKALQIKAGEDTELMLFDLS